MHIISSKDYVRPLSYTLKAILWFHHNWFKKLFF